MLADPRRRASGRSGGARASVAILGSAGGSAIEMRPTRATRARNRSGGAGASCRTSAVTITWPPTNCRSVCCRAAAVG